MFKRCFAMMLALCLLLTSSSVAFMEENSISEELLSTEVASELSEVVIEEVEPQEITDDTEEITDVIEPASPADGSVVIEAVDETAEDEVPAAEEGAPEEPVVEETPEVTEDAVAQEATDNNEEEAPVAEETAVTEAPAAAEEPVAEAPAAVEAPAVVEEAPVVVEASADTAAKLETAEAGVAEMVLTKSAKYTATMGDFIQLNLGGLTAKSFKSSKKKVATVNGTGLIACVGGGKTKITATISKKKKIVLTLTVLDPTKPTAVYLSMDGAAVSGTITAAKGVPFTLTPAVAPEGTAVTGFKWSSSKKKVASVNGAGVVTPKKVGTTKITVKTTRGGKKRSVKVKVIDPYKATAVYLSKTGLIYMTAKSTLQLTAAMVPENSTSTLKWSSSNKKVASVSKNGLVTAKKKGTAKITVKTSSGKKRSVKIKVFPLAGAAKSMVGEWTTLDEDNTLNPNDLYTYVVSMKPLNANANVVWSVAETANEVIRVENAYRGDDLKFLAEVRAVDLGYTTLTATDTVTGLSASVKLIVKPASEPTSISFPELVNNTATVGRGQVIKVKYQVDPQDSLSHPANRAHVDFDPTYVSAIDYDNNNAARNCRNTMNYYITITASNTPGSSTVTVRLDNNVNASFTLIVQ